MIISEVNPVLVQRINKEHPTFTVHRILNGKPVFSHEVEYDYPASYNYIALGEYLNQVYGDELEGKLIVDAGCNVGGGVLYLREKFGVDARGIDPVLEGMDNQSFIDEIESRYSFASERHYEDINKLLDAGILIGGFYQSIPKFFVDDSIDALCFVMWTNEDGAMPVGENRLSRAVKDKGYIFQIKNDCNKVAHSLRVAPVFYGISEYIDLHDRNEGVVENASFEMFF